MHPTLILIHLPKTGGASVRATAERNYPQSQTLHAPGGSSRDERAWLLDIAPRQLQRTKLICGHLRYGLHELLEQDCEYSTIIRHPAERIRSLYRWLSDNPRPKTDRFIAGGFEAFALGDCISDLDNGQTRMLATMQDVAGDPPTRAVNDNDFELAIGRLDRMPVVGTADNHRRYLDRLAAKYQWSDTDLPHIHKAHHQLDRDEDLMDEIARRNSYDLSLYLEAKRHEERMG